MPEYSDLLIQLRRFFHSQPEKGWTEFVTTARIAETLENCGFEVLLGEKVINRRYIRGMVQQDIEQGIIRAKECGVSHSVLKDMGGITGCAGIWRSPRPGKTLALRFDIDCVSVEETQSEDHIPHQEGFSSQYPGCMHACAHDGHIAIGLTMARWIQANRHSLSGSIILLFQPAEEGARGARPMAESGIVDNVDYLLSSHLSFIANSGEVVVDPQQFLSTTKMTAVFNGKAAHAGAQPHQGHNALAAACHATTQILGISRHGDGMSRVNVGALHSGVGSNVIPDHAEMSLEVRGETDEINKFMFHKVEHILAGCSLGFQVDHRISITGEASTLKNDHRLVTLLSEIAGELPEIKNIVRQRTFGGSEDATVLIQRVQRHGGQGLYFIVGADRVAGHHQSNFDFDEHAMFTAFKIYCELIKSLSQ